MGYEGLTKQSIDVRLGGGIAQSEHDFLTDAPGLLKAENVRFDKRGALGKRFGHTTTTLNNAPSTSALGESNAAFEHRDQLVVIGPAGCHYADITETTWRETNKRAPRVSRVLTDSVIRSNADTSRGFADVAGDLMCVAWNGFAPEEHGSAGLPCTLYQFFDAATLAPKCPPKVLEPAATGFVPLRVLSFSDGTFMVVSEHATTARFATYDTAAGTYTFANHAALPGPTPTAATGAIGRFAKGAADDFVVVLNNLGTMEVSAFDSAGASLGTDTEAAWVVSDVAWNSVTAEYVALSADGSVRHINAAGTVTGSTGGVTADATATDARIAQRSSSGHMLFAFTCDTGTQLFLVTSALSESSTGYVAHLGAEGDHVPELLYLGDLGIDDTLVTWIDRVSTFSLVPNEVTGPPPSYSLPQPYMIFARPVLFDGAEGSELGVAEVGRCLHDRAAVLCPGFIYGTEARLFVRTAVDVLGSTDANTTRYGYDLARVQIENAPARSGVQSSGLRLVPGGSGVVCYDGVRLAELTPPRVQHLAQDSWIVGADEGDIYGNSGNVPGFSPGTGEEVAGSYFARARVLYRWVDSRGNVHRGAPSGPLRWEIFGAGAPNDGGAPNPAINPNVIKFPRVGITAINGDTSSQLQVEVYQATSPDGETWHLIGVCTPKIHPTDPDYWYLSPAWGRSTLLEHQFNLQYTDAIGELPQGYFDLEADNVPPPPLLHLCSTQARLWGLSAEDRNRVVYTKEIVSGRAPEFGDGFGVQIPDEGGSEDAGESGCTGIAAINDVVIVFKRGRVYQLFGDPGDAAGAGSSLQVPRCISSDVGCVDATSIVEGPFGVAFLSLKGFYLLGRDLSLTFIGEAVQKEVGTLTCTSATLVPRHSEIRWLFDASIGANTTPIALTWNYKANAWSRWTSYTGRSATIYRDEFTRMHALYAYSAETTDTWGSSATHEVIVRTPWMKLAGLQGFKRIWRAAFLGRWWTGDVSISCEYDYKTLGAGDTLDSQSWTASTLSTLLEPSQYEEAGSVSTGAYRLQLVRKPSIQKVEAIRFTITENAEAAQDEPSLAGRGFELVGVQLEVGLKRGGGHRTLSAGAKK